MNKNWYLNFEWLLRKLPVIGIGPQPKSPTKILTDWNIRYSDLAQGRSVHVTTWREIANRHQKALAGGINCLFIAALSFVVAMVCLQLMLANGTSMWGLFATVAIGASAYYYREARGQYNDFTDYERMPAVVPTIDLEATMNKTPLEQC